MFTTFHEGEQDITFAVGQPWTHVAIDSLKVAVAAMNSTIALSDRPAERDGLLGCATPPNWTYSARRRTRSRRRCTENGHPPSQGREDTRR
ncbi:hypothetical protein [Frankia gtarii]|uniref:hypothetical protein n=1 Tax=Frankia gtarii TaxID=2950102 RepID=UPI0021C1D892|nr:hypothetical protein [Frankia gtarii]